MACGCGGGCGGGGNVQYPVQQPPSLDNLPEPVLTKVVDVSKSNQLTNSVRIGLGQQYAFVNQPMLNSRY